MRWCRCCALLIRARAVVVLVFLLLLGATWWVYRTVPSGFVPEEDQGYVMVIIQAPPGASLDYTMNIVRQTEQIDAEGRRRQDDVRGGRVRLHRHRAEPGHLSSRS